MINVYIRNALLVNLAYRNDRNHCFIFRKIYLLYIFRLFLLPSDKTIYFFFKVARALVTDNSKLENVFVNLLRVELATIVLS